MSQSSEILTRIYRKTYHANVVRIEGVIAEVAQVLVGLDRTEAEIYAERSKQGVWNQLIKRIDEDARKRLYPTFEVVDPTRFLVAWYPTIQPTDDAKMKAKKFRLSHRGAILDFIDNMTSREYEALGGVMCQIAGANRWHLTPPGNEFGIDFLALLPSFGSTHVFPHMQKQLLVVGQAKKWNTRTKRNEIDLLSKTLEKIRNRNQRVFESGVLPNWFVTSKGLLVGVMLAHTGTQSGGGDVADDEGIILTDSRDVAEIVALSRKWDVTLGLPGVIEFLKTTVDARLQSSGFTHG